MASRSGTKRKLARGPSLYSFGNSVAQKRRRAAEHGSVSNPFRTAVPHLPEAIRRHIHEYVLADPSVDAILACGHRFHGSCFERHVSGRGCPHCAVWR